LETRICDLTLPQLDKKWGLGYTKLLELMWKRTPEERISRRMAVQLCSMMLWGFPLVDPSIHSTDAQKFFQARRKLSHLQLEDCQKWLMKVKHKFYQQFSKQPSLDRLDIAGFLQVQFLSNTTPEELLECVRYFVFN
jgi:hypothetical protein